MVERHRDAESIALAELHRLADEIAVIDDVEVGQGRALGAAGGAARELDVDALVRIQGRAYGQDARAVGVVASVRDVFETEHTGQGVLCHTDHGLQMRQARRP